MVMVFFNGCGRKVDASLDTSHKDSLRRLFCCFSASATCSARETTWDFEIWLISQDYANQMSGPLLMTLTVLIITQLNIKYAQSFVHYNKNVSVCFSCDTMNRRPAVDSGSVASDAGRFQQLVDALNMFPAGSPGFITVATQITLLLTRPEWTSLKRTIGDLFVFTPEYLEACGTDAANRIACRVRARSPRVLLADVEMIYQLLLDLLGPFCTAVETNRG